MTCEEFAAMATLTVTVFVLFLLGERCTTHEAVPPRAQLVVIEARP